MHSFTYKINAAYKLLHVYCVYGHSVHESTYHYYYYWQVVS